MDFAKSQNLKLMDKSGRSVAPSELQGKVVALYFSAHWCPPCRGFTPMLKGFYETIKAKGLPFEIIFVSGDKSQSEASSYFQNDHGDWLILDLGQKEDVSSKFQIKGIPTLIVIDAAGKAVAPEARDQVASAQNPEAVEKVFADWQKLCADWRATAGASVGGAPAAQDAAAMRAARLAKLGGGSPVPAPAPAAPETAPAPTPTPAPAPAVNPAPAPAPAVTPTPAPAADAAPAQVVDLTQESNADPQAEAIQQITGMGFTEEQAKHALEAAAGNVETAVALLLDQ